MPRDERISLNEAARRAGVSPATLTRWADEKIVPVRKGRWTPAAAAQARVVARMRERGHSLEDLKEAGKDGKLAFGFTEEFFADKSEPVSISQAAIETGLSEELIERIMVVLGTPTGRERFLSEVDVDALGILASVAHGGLPIEAVLQLVRVYAQAVRRIADAEVRLFHLFVHEPMMRDGLGAMEMAEEMGQLVELASPTTRPLFEYLHDRYVRYFIEQDVVGHMEDEFSGDLEADQIRISLCFIDLTGFTRFTEEEGDAEAFSVIEQFTEAVEATLPPEANIVKTIGDEVMVVSPDPVTLVEWAVGFLALFEDRPKPRAGVHYGGAVFRDGDYYGGQVNLAHRVVNRALGGEVLVTEPVADAIGEHEDLELDGLGAVELKGFPEPTPLYLVRVRK
ncbi:MAG TPA: adenylate/guanylate cyclase domain-containing protein [Solirubrobacterales bacterium]|nr:adenylate/guanylate cyclase domain-containing protein [Solirubrobacterales bacterium]